MSGEITSALRKIKNQNVNMIEDKAKVCAMLNDLEPSLHKERRRVRLLYETGAIHSIAKAVSNPEGAKLYLSQAVNLLTDQADMNAGAAAETVNYFVPLWNLPEVEGQQNTASALDTDAIFDMMARADNDKKARSSHNNGGRAAGGRGAAYAQRTSPQQNPNFTQPLKKAGRVYGTQQNRQQTNNARNYAYGGNTAQNSVNSQPNRNNGGRIYGSASKRAASTASTNGGYIPSGNTQSGGGTGLFARHAQTPAWKNIAVKVRQVGGNTQVASSLKTAQQAAEDLCRFYRPQLAAAGTDVQNADKLCKKAVLLTALAPSRAIKYYMQAAAEGDVAHLSLFGRQILAWPQYLELEASMGFACLQMAVDRGAECGAYALAHCYHTGTGILKCHELAEKYYRMAAGRHPEITEQVNRRIDQLHHDQMPTDSLWRYF